MLSWLLTLLALAFVATLAVSQVTVSTNDPFRAIVVKHRALHPEPPLCCLKPLPSADPPEGPEDILLSFEEWKSKQLHAHSQTASQATATEASERTTSDTSRDTETPSPVDTHATAPEPSFPQDSLPPHFRVPITDRFNFANMDCSARVHMAHRSAKSASSILSEKKDKYMLSPCTSKNGGDQFVVVELCDDIRIDTVQLANFEFFSGVFKDFTVRVAKTYPATDDGWTFAGTYRGKNIRGVQSFHPPTSLRDFYRYIRIDFHSYYGHEYYCPISLLRVYGLTHLEQWKWVMWEAESRARLEEQRLLIAEVAPASSNSIQRPPTDMNTFVDILESGSVNASEIMSGGNFSSPQEGGVMGLSNSSSTMQAPHGGISPTSSATPPAAHGSPESTPLGEYSQATPHVMSSSLAEVISSIASMMSHETPFATSLNQPTSEHISTRVSESQSSHTLSTHASVTSAASNSRSYTSVHSPAPSGESIFGTIMNKLTALEANHTLYARYVEEQITGVREVLRKLGEEVGRLESIEQMQSQMYLRTVQEWERQRLRLELEHSELLSRVNHLADEVVLEKRLGIAQLCLLLAVLVFMGFTRGAPYVEQSQADFNRSAREWGTRPLSLGSNKELGGWNPLRLRSLSPTVQCNGAEKMPSSEARMAFPSSTSQRQPSFIDLTPRHLPRESVSSSTSSLHKHFHGHHSTRTPTRRRQVLSVDPRSIPQVLPIAKSNSSTASPHPTPRSTKRLARTAHLHEVKLFRHRRGSGAGITRRLERRGNEENEHDDDVFRVGTPPSSQPNTSHLGRRGPFRPLFPTARSEDDKETDGWIDTDMDGSEVVSDTAPYDST